MKKRLYLILSLFFVLTINHTSYACTSIYIVSDSLILAGKNQDFGTWKTMVRFTPPKDGRLGTAYFGGTNVFPTGGINSEGLFYEYHQGEYPKKFDTLGKTVFSGDLVDKIMSECGTVHNVIDTLKKYTHPYLFTQNIAFGDKLGNSIILEGDTFFYRKGNYQICTSFYESKHDMSTFNFWKYRNAEKKIKADSILSINTIKHALNSAHDIFTQYSVIYDFKKELIYVYLYHDYNQVKVFNLREEFKKDEHFYYLPDFFPDNEAYYETYIKRQVPQNNWLIAVFSGLFIISSFVSLISALTIGIIKKEKMNRWISWLTKLVLGLVSILSLVYAFRFFSDPESLQIGLFHPINKYYSLRSQLILHIPKVLAILVFMMIIISIIHWKNSWYNFFRRIYFSVYTTLLLILILLLMYWDFVIL